MIQKTAEGWKAVATQGWTIGVFKTKREAREAEMEQKAKEMQKKLERRARSA